MTKEFYPFYKIKRFNETIKEIKQKYGVDTSQRVRIELTPKLDGTNCAVVFLKDGTYYCQSKNRIISVDDDHHGFSKFVKDNEADFFKLRDSLTETDEVLIVYGEFVGQGISKNHAICLTQHAFFIIDAFVVNEGVKEPIMFEESFVSDTIKNIRHFSTVDIVETNEARDYYKQLNERLRNEFEYCPVTYALYGERGPLEGLVGEVSVYGPGGALFYFKIKNDDKIHNNLEAPLYKNMTQFAQLAIDIRCQQAIDYMKECHGDIWASDKMNEKIKLFTDWIVNDILAEDGEAYQKFGKNEASLKRVLMANAKKYFLDIANYE